MRKLNLSAYIGALGLALFLCSTNAEGQMAGGMGRAFAVNDIMDVHVKNLQGDVLGRIVDLIVDSEGKIALAVLSHGGFLGINVKETAVPFGALKYDPNAKQLILDISKEKLAAAPAFTMSELSNQREAEDIYRYFGEQPYWSEDGELLRGVNEPLEGAPTE